MAGTINGTGLVRLSPHFTLSELTVSQEASRRGWSNTPPAAAVMALRDLCTNVLEPVRAHFGKPVVVSSGYRSPKVNRAIGGSATSQHMSGQAADFEIPGVSNCDVAVYIRDHVPFDQLILEFYSPGQPNSGWVHVSWRPGRLRKQVLTAARRRGALGRMKTVYLPGLVA